MSIADAVSHLRDLDEAVGELRAVRDRLATLLYALEIERPWVVPRSHRPTCPVDGRPCTHWSCLVDVCVDVGVDGQARDHEFRPSRPLESAGGDHAEDL